MYNKPRDFLVKDKSQLGGAKLRTLRGYYINGA